MGFIPRSYQLMEFLGVPAVRIDRGVRAQPDFDPAADGFPDRSGQRLRGLPRLLFHGGRQVAATGHLFPQTLGGHQGGHEVRTPRLHHVECFVVQEGAVLDGIDAGADRPFGARCPVGMGGRLAAQRVGFVHQRVEFGLGELRRVDVIGQGEAPRRWRRS